MLKTPIVLLSSLFLVSPLSHSQMEKQNEVFRLPASLPPLAAEGLKLFNNSCRKCHGSLRRASIKGSSEQEIREAVSTVKRMKPLLEGKLTEREFQALTAALNTAPSPARPEEANTETDKKIAAENPALFITAKKYFESESTEAPKARIVRLTRIQIDNSVRSLLPKYFKDSVSKAMPPDPLQTNYEYAENLSLNAANFSKLADWIKAIADRVRKDPSGIFTCEGQGNLADCRKKQAEKFVLRAFHWDPTPAKVAKFTAFFQKRINEAPFEQAAGDLVEAVLNSPVFLYRNEVSATGDKRLSDRQMLSQLSFAFTDSPADPVATQASGFSPENITDQILRSKEGRLKLFRFFLAWLEIKDPRDFRLSAEIFPKFTPEVAKALNADFQKTLLHELARPNPKLRELIQTKDFFPSPELSFLYDATAAGAMGDKPVTQDPQHRAGLFSHPAFIASHSGPTSTRLIKRGVFWVRKVMCMELDPPPPGLDTSIKADASSTERVRIESGTRSSSCKGCHGIINPFGSMLENYDPLGAWREKEGNFPVDARVAMEDVLEDGNANFSGPIEAISALTETPKFRQCFARQLFRFYMGRNEVEADDPLLREMFYELTQTGDLIQTLKIMAASSRMRQRAILNRSSLH